MSVAIKTSEIERDLVPATPPQPGRARRTFAPFSWLWWTIAMLYLVLPLYGTFVFSLQKTRGTLSFAA